MKYYFGYVYIWYDRKRKMFYIGSHYGTLNDGYISSSTWFNSAYKKRPQDFKRRILAYNYSDDFREIQILEQKYLNMIKDNELSTSRNVIEGCNRYYNTKKWANGGSHKGHTKNRIKPSWNKGITKEMLLLRKKGLFLLLGDKPKETKPPRVKKVKVFKSTEKRVAWNKGKKRSPEINEKMKDLFKKLYPDTTLTCVQCSKEFVKPYRNRNRKTCSISCRGKLNGKNTNRAENGRKGAPTLSKTVTGRKKMNLADGTWTWIYPEK